VEYRVAAAFPEIPEISRIIGMNAYVTRLKADLSQFVERREHLSDSEVVSPTELDGIDDDIEQTEQLLQQQLWLLEDTVDQLQSQLEGNRQATAIAELNVDTKMMDVSTARYQYDRGDIHASDVAQVELLHTMAADQLSALEQSRFVLTLEALSMMNVSLKQWVQEALAE